ncbi:hypothetical protein BSK71_04695 [Pectobacterium actinidiae]|uniref:HTH iclR-type domain-containing protein n=1 Tax=Pectobacterium actinidiae TaxID=1507808 RepID=A0A1V2R860_9GAMM|nr:helix-turn-helix domain-containing protein [Pectobacterium actinidiae]KHN91196.1 IclR family transcriptional regulator [Pectobacterium actinidiae]ONK04659.1 hypothetical protein BSK69_10620 [Pectobacterium actinidiae]ONK08532.1 hypothetical protein BSK71_04695 [Pectobacterium actinidiae]
MIDKSGGGIQVISRAAAILREVCESPDGLSLGQLAALTGLARSTVQRIVDALESEHLVQAGAKGFALVGGCDVWGRYQVRGLLTISVLRCIDCMKKQKKPSIYQR